MPLDEKGVKWACAPCIRGHRSSKCDNYDRVMIRVKKPGRPLSSCPHEKVKCTCAQKRFMMFRIFVGPDQPDLCRPKYEVGTDGERIGAILGPTPPPYEQQVLEKSSSKESSNQNATPSKGSTTPQPSLGPAILPQPQESFRPLSGEGKNQHSGSNSVQWPEITTHPAKLAYPIKQQPHSPQETLSTFSSKGSGLLNEFIHPRPLLPLPPSSISDEHPSILSLPNDVLMRNGLSNPANTGSANTGHFERTSVQHGLLPSSNIGDDSTSSLDSRGLPDDGLGLIENTAITSNGSITPHIACAEDTHFCNASSQCRCGETCQCLACLIHPKNQRTRELMEDLGQILEEDIPFSRADEHQTHSMSAKSPIEPITTWAGSTCCAPSSLSAGFNKELSPPPEDGQLPPGGISMSEPFYQEFAIDIGQEDCDFDSVNPKDLFSSSVREANKTNG